MKNIIFIIFIIFGQNLFAQAIECFPFVNKTIPNKIVLSSTIILTQIDTLKLYEPTDNKHYNSKHLSLNVYDKNSNKLIQIIDEKSHFPVSIFTEDLNFDGFKDIEIEYNYLGEHRYSIWLYEEKHHFFRYSKEFSQFSDFDTDSSNSNVITTFFDSKNDSFVYITYRVDSLSRLTHIKRETLFSVSKEELSSPIYSSINKYLVSNQNKYVIYKCDSLINNKFQTIKFEIRD